MTTLTAYNVSWFLPLFSVINIIKRYQWGKESIETFLSITKCFPFTTFTIWIPGFMDLSSIPWIHIGCGFVKNQYLIFPENSPSKAY